MLQWMHNWLTALKRRFHRSLSQRHRNVILATLLRRKSRLFSWSSLLAVAATYRQKETLIVVLQTKGLWSRVFDCKREWLSSPWVHPSSQRERIYSLRKRTGTVNIKSNQIYRIYSNLHEQRQCKLHIEQDSKVQQVALRQLPLITILGLHIAQ